MGLLDLAKRDMASITSNKSTGWAASLFITNKALETFTVNGLWSNHRITVDGEGKPDNAKNVHCSFSESLVVALGFSIRNAAGLVDLKDWTVRVDLLENGIEVPGITYLFREWWPSETLGFVVCLLGDIDA